MIQFLSLLPSSGNHLSMSDTIGKWYSFIGGFIFVGTDEYIQIIFIGFETDEYNFIFIGSIRQMTNVWVIRFNLDRPHIFVGDMAYIRRLTQGCRYEPAYIHLLTNEYKGDLETRHFPFSLFPMCFISFTCPLCPLLVPPPPLCLRCRHHLIRALSPRSSPTAATVPLARHHGTAVAP
jgi:hypothetical protein